MIARRAAVFGSVILALVVVFQVGLVLGAPWGILTQGGFDAGQLAPPGRVVAAVSAVLSATFALGLLGRAGLGLLADSWRAATVVTWACLLYSIVGSVMNGVSQSSTERLVWTPVCIVLAACAALVLRGSQRRRPTAK